VTSMSDAERTASPPFGSPAVYGARARAAPAGGDDLPAIAVEALSKRYIVGRRETRLGRILRRRGLTDDGGGEDDEDDDDLDEVEEAYAPPTRVAELREIWALRDVSFVMPQGAALGIVGPHGSGKTTLAKILARLTSPTSGRAVVRGRVAPLLDGGTSFVTADATGRKNVREVARFYGVPRAVVDERLDEILRLAELDGMADVRAGAYSSGLLRRLPLATILNFDPHVLIFEDAAFGNDAVFRERALTRIDELIAGGLTLMIITHDLDLVRRHCTDALYLNGGVVAEYGPADEVLAAYRPTRTPEDPSKVNRAVRAGFNAHASIHGASIAADEELTHGAPFRISIEVEVATRRTEILCGVVLMRNEGGRVTLRQPAPFVAEEPGLYSVLAAVPRGLTVGGTYAADVGAVVRVDDEEARLMRSDLFTFALAGPTEGEPSEPGARWRVEYEGEAVAFVTGATPPT
jgi:lipopolysaccharide transport system ATP-binding protein